MYIRTKACTYSNPSSSNLTLPTRLLLDILFCQSTSKEIPKILKTMGKRYIQELMPNSETSLQCSWTNSLIDAPWPLRVNRRGTLHRYRMVDGDQLSECGILITHCEVVRSTCTLPPSECLQPVGWRNLQECQGLSWNEVGDVAWCSFGYYVLCNLSGRL